MNLLWRGQAHTSRGYADRGSLNQIHGDVRDALDPFGSGANLHRSGRPPPDLPAHRIDRGHRRIARGPEDGAPGEGLTRAIQNSDAERVGIEQTHMHRGGRRRHLHTGHGLIADGDGSRRLHRCGLSRGSDGGGDGYGAHRHPFHESAGIHGGDRRLGRGPLDGAARGRKRLAASAEEIGRKLQLLSGQHRGQGRCYRRAGHRCDQYDHGDRLRRRGALRAFSGIRDGHGHRPWRPGGHDTSR